MKGLVKFITFFYKPLAFGGQPANFTDFNFLQSVMQTLLT